MARKITKKQKEFADEYLETGNGVKAALKAYGTDDYNTAGVIAHENLNKPKIIEYFESVSSNVAANMYKLALSAESEQVQVSAGKDVLDRAGYKPVDRKDITTDGEKINQVTISQELQEIADEYEEKTRKQLQS